jgi:hypothetical protein
VHFVESVNGIKGIRTGKEHPAPSAVEGVVVAEQPKFAVQPLFVLLPLDIKRIVRHPDESVETNGEMHIILPYSGDGEIIGEAIEGPLYIDNKSAATSVTNETKFRTMYCPVTAGQIVSTPFSLLV